MILMKRSEIQLPRSVPVPCSIVDLLTVPKIGTNTSFLVNLKFSYSTTIVMLNCHYRATA